MKRCLLLLILASPIYFALSQRVERRPDGNWLTLPANYSKWTIEGSTNGSNWFPFLVKTGLGPLKSIELLLATNDTVQFWRLVESSQ